MPSTGQVSSITNCYRLIVDKAPRLSISIVIWILSSDTICQLNQFITNSEAAMLSSLSTPREPVGGNPATPFPPRLR